MKKTLKTKVLAGTIAVALLSSAGVAFAATDAGGAFKVWYGKQFISSTANVTVANAVNLNHKLGEFAGYVSGKKTDTSTEISSKKTGEITRVGGNIETAKNTHVDKVNAAKKQIMDNMEKQFDALYNLGKSGINTAFITAHAAANRDLDKHASSQGSAAVTDVNEKLLAAQNTAVGQLETVVNEAKAEVRKALEDQEDLTIGRLQGYINSKYNEVTGKIDTLVAELIATQKGLIEAEANAREEAAKKALQDVVNGINK